MKPSEIKLDEFNDCPGTESIRRYLDERRLTGAVHPVDVDSDLAYSYQNDGATLVLAVQQQAPQIATALNLGAVAVAALADEFTWDVILGQVVVRLWWD